MTEQSSITTGENSPAAPAKRIFFVLAAYFGIQVILRLLTSSSADLDESEQLVFTQQFQWGYGPQPPLYTWLQILVFKITTPSILGLSLLKNFLLFGTYALTYLNARLVTQSHALGVAAAAALLFVPEIAWESQRDLTHTVLATTLATAAFHLFLRLRENNSAANYFFFGACCGFGLLANYNFAAFVFGLIVASLALMRFRNIFLNGKILLAMLVCASILLPHFLWAMHNFDIIASTSHKFKIQGDRLTFKILFEGLKNLVSATGTHIGALIGIVGLLALTSRKSGRNETTGRDVARLILCGIAVVLATLVCSVVLFKVTSFKDRWFQPVFICLPVALVVFFQNRLGAKQIRALVTLAILVAVAICVSFPTRIWFAEKLHRREQLVAPFDRFSEKIRAEFPTAKTIVAEDLWLGGNLRRCFPEAQVLTPQLPDSWRRDDAMQTSLLIWNATRKESPPESILSFARNISRFDEADTRHIESTLKYFQSKKMRLGIVAGK